MICGSNKSKKYTFKLIAKLLTCRPESIFDLFFFNKRWFVFFGLTHSNPFEEKHKNSGESTQLYESFALHRKHYSLINT